MEELQTPAAVQYLVFLLVTLKMYLLIRLIKKHSTRSNKMNKQESVYYYYFH